MHTWSVVRTWSGGVSTWKWAFEAANDYPGEWRKTGISISLGIRILENNVYCMKKVPGNKTAGRGRYLNPLVIILQTFNVSGEFFLKPHLWEVETTVQLNMSHKSKRKDCSSLWSNVYKQELDCERKKKKSSHITIWIPLLCCWLEVLSNSCDFSISGSNAVLSSWNSHKRLPGSQFSVEMGGDPQQLVHSSWWCGPLCSCFAKV